MTSTTTTRVAGCNVLFSFEFSPLEGRKLTRPSEVDERTIGRTCLKHLVIVKVRVKRGWAPIASVSGACSAPPIARWSGMHPCLQGVFCHLFPVVALAAH